VLGRGAANRAASVVAAVPRPCSSRAPSEQQEAPGRAGTALPSRQATDPAGGARDPGLLRWICWRREEERERGSAAAGRRTGGGRRVAVGSARVRG